MKYVAIVGDGMSDRPLKELRGKTPLEVASKKNMDFIAREGCCGQLKTLYRSLPLCSSVANLSLLGYDPRKYYTGRGPLEAVNKNIRLAAKDIVFRCNLITVSEDNKIVDYSAGHISNSESEKLMKEIDGELGSEGIRFYPGVSYRNLLVLRREYSPDVRCKPPHDIVGRPLDRNLAKSVGRGKKTADLLNKLTLSSRNILEDHPINKRRISEGKNPGNMIWLWGGGRKPRMPPFKKKFNVTGSLISAVDLLKGIAKTIGLEVIDVPGATGYYDTDYRGKADYALKSLAKNDFVYVHVEATDEAGHEGSIKGKIKAIEDLDEKLVGKILDNIHRIDDNYAIGVLPDHATPIEARTHTIEPVPFAIYSTSGKKDAVESYSEKASKKGVYGLMQGFEFMPLLLSL